MIDLGIGGVPLGQVTCFAQLLGQGQGTAISKLFSTIANLSIHKHSQELSRAPPCIPSIAKLCMFLVASPHNYAVQNRSPPSHLLKKSIDASG